MVLGDTYIIQDSFMADSDPNSPNQTPILNWFFFLPRVVQLVCLLIILYYIEPWWVFSSPTYLFSITMQNEWWSVQQQLKKEKHKLKITLHFQ